MWIDLTDRDRELVIGCLKLLTVPEAADLIKRIEQRKAEDEDEKLKAYIERARSQNGKGGELEFDEGAVVSVSDDGGAYVMGWSWVYDKDEGDADVDDEVDQDDICDSCGDQFTDFGPGQRSAVDGSICEYCYVNEENEYDDYDYVDDEDEDDEEERP